MKRFLPGLLLFLFVLACGGPALTPAPVTSGKVVAAARRDTVQTVADDGTRQTLPAKARRDLHVGEGVDVDSSGDALLQFADLLVVEITRDGDLQLSEFQADDESALVDLVNTSGLLLADFNSQQEINRRLRIDAGFAEIVVTGTRFLIDHEQDSPLLWVVGLDAASKDLLVTAGGVSKDVVTGQARWVAPVGEPSPGVTVDLQSINEWLDALRAGEIRPELGDVIWSPPDALSTTKEIAQLPALGQPFSLLGVDITLDEKGLNGAPRYSLHDCNGDGINDIAMKHGIVHFDFRPLTARVRALDVTILKEDASGADLRALDPAQEEIAVQSPGASESYAVLSLRSRQGNVFHYATLAMEAGCFLGFSLTPPKSNGEPGDPRPAVTPGGGATPAPTPKPTPTPTSTSTSTPTSPPPPLPDLAVYDLQLLPDSILECDYANWGDATPSNAKLLLTISVNGIVVWEEYLNTPVGANERGLVNSGVLSLPEEFEASCLIDAADQIDEADEENNFTTAPFYNPQAAQPDLIAYPPTLVEGNRIECAYANIGAETATRTDIYMDIYIDGERVSFGTIDVPLAPREEGWLRSQPLDLPAQFTAACVIDGRGTLAESDETNNRAAARLRYEAGGCAYATTADFVDLAVEMELGCATSAAYNLTASWQPFAYGSMIWREDTDLLYVLVAEATVTPLIPPGEWRSFANEWRSGMPEYACREAEALAEEGRPVHFGFGWLWCNDSYLRETVGEPQQDEIGGERWFQSFEHGWMMHIGEWDDGIVVVRDDDTWYWFPRP